MCHPFRQREDTSTHGGIECFAFGGTLLKSNVEPRENSTRSIGLYFSFYLWCSLFSIFVAGSRELLFATVPVPVGEFGKGLREGGSSRECLEETLGPRRGGNCRRENSPG